MATRRWVVRVVAGLLLLCVIVTIVSAILNLKLPRHSSPVDRLSEGEKALLQEFDQVRRELGEIVWPGWEALDMPVIVYNEEYAFLVGYANPPAGWLKIPQSVVRGGPWELVPNDSVAGIAYYRQPLPATGETPEAFTVQVGEQWVASMPTLAWMEISLGEQFRDGLPAFVEPVFPYALVTGLFLRGSDGYISLLAHESFHAYQGSVAPESLAAAETVVSVAEDRYPWSDSDVQTAWQAELDLLVQALRAETEVEVVELSRQFLTQRTERREDMGVADVLVEYERRREWLEGLARYVELEIWQQASLAEAYVPVTAMQANDDFSGYGTFARRWSQELDQIGRMANDEGGGRFYYSGMAQAALLDQLMPGWKAQTMREDVFLEDLLELAVNGSDG